MCYTCYEEAGKPEIVNDNTKRAAELIDAVYDAPGCITGGYAHIVIDDYNLLDSNINWCLDNAQNGRDEFTPEEGRQACIKCLEFLLTLSESERYTAMAIHEGWITVGKL